MLPSGISDLIKQLTVDIVTGKDNTPVVGLTDLQCTFSETSEEELISQAGMGARSDGSYRFRRRGGNPLPAIDSTMVVLDNGSLRQIVNVNDAGGQGEHLRVYVVFI